MRVLRLAAVLLIAAAGAWLGIFLSGTVHAPVGPVDTGMSLRPAWRGETVVDASPLGTLSFRTHTAPLRLRVTLENIDQEQAKALLEDPRLTDRLPGIIERDLRDGIETLVIRSILCATAGALVAVLLVFRRPVFAFVGITAAAVGLAATGAAAAVTFRPQSLMEPRYTGLIAAAPSLIGSAESIMTRFESYRGQLTKLVTNVSKLYDTVSGLPVYDADPGSVRVLHVSDIHINPIAWDVTRSLKDQFKIDLIVDTGDLSDHGTKAENYITDDIGKLGVPYVFIRGNHDSKITQRAVARHKNAIVLDNAEATVAGLRIYGLGDPRFTPDKSVAADNDPARLEQFGREHAVRLPQPGPDLVAVHDPTIGKGFSGSTPMILAGHAHRRSTTVFASGTRVLVQGSTGGAGLRALEHAEPTPVQASVLYFDKRTHRLQAWDDVTLGGLGEQSIHIRRHVEPDPGRMISPAPTNAPSPTGTITGTTTPASPLWHEGQSSPMLQRSPTEGVGNRM
ncbi:metallophosphoesterase [Nonomuraea sp. NPDC050310]|uniref:metallophosphoesterase family protein n=1 Tax=Nonomuraea sp. NPDC050310 TaxID=3154935 RepID=UPI0033EFDA17